jgi:hypothetical protein
MSALDRFVLQSQTSHIVLAWRVFCYYNLLVATWNETKRRKNIKDHGFDFVGCEAIWDNFTITREDITQGGKT